MCREREDEKRGEKWRQGGREQVREREGERGRDMTHREMGKDRRRVRGRGWLGKRVEGGKEKEKVTKQEEKEGASYNEGGKERGRRKW